MKGSEQMKASIVFECEDIFGTYEKMKTNGVEFIGEPNQMEWGPSFNLRTKTEMCFY